jgi:hypothetical protein
VPGRFKPAVGAANQAIAQRDKQHRPALLPEGLRLYDLRHTAASLMIREGASVKAVQRQLGHATTSITLDTYGRLFPDELDAPRPLGGPSRPGAGGAAGRRGVAPRWPRGRRLRQTCRSVAREARAGGGARARPHPGSTSKVVAVNAA